MVATTLRCPACDHDNPPDAISCENCGTNLVRATRHQRLRRAQQEIPASDWATGGKRNLFWLGERLDGWADLIDGMAERAPDVIQAFQELVSVRRMPEVRHESSMLTTGGLMGKKRSYQIVHTRTGASLAVYIGQFGRDLYIAWDLFLRPVVWRKKVILGILVASAVLGFFPAYDQDPWIGQTTFDFFVWIGCTIGLSILFAVLIGGAGFVLRGSSLAFFRRELDAFDVNDIAAIALAVHKSLLQAVDAVGIDIQSLRAKEQFRGGRRDRLI